MVKRFPLVEMKTGQTGTIVEISAGKGIHSRLLALGLREGIKITKVSSAFAKGPVVLKVYGTQIALGYGISRKVIVEVTR